MARVNVDWPTAVVGKADNVCSMLASACHIGGPIYVNPGELALVYGIIFLKKIAAKLNLVSAKGKNLPFPFILEPLGTLRLL